MDGRDVVIDPKRGGDAPAGKTLLGRTGGERWEGLDRHCSMAPVSPTLSLPLHFSLSLPATNPLRSLYHNCYLLR